MDPLVDTEWLQKQLGAPDLRVLDCTVILAPLPEGGWDVRSGRDAWQQGHIPSSQHVDLLQELSDPDSPIPLMVPPAEQFAAVMARLGVGDGCRVVLYDTQMNMWAARMWWMLRAVGFTAAAVLDGGWQAWSTEARPTASGSELEPQPATFTTRPDPGLFVGKDDVLAALDQPRVGIVNGLEREVHRGEQQHYARPGHIPGARNVPFSELVDPRTHRYLPLEQLRQVFADVLSSAPDTIITYCGAAIAASSVAFALRLLGVNGVAIYDGSMLEWAADPALPLVTGD